MAEPASIAANAEPQPTARIAAVGGGLTRVPTWAVPATVALAVASILISLAAALTRGPWIDEFWTLFAIDPGLPLSEALRQRWLTDVHPPLFYFESRLLSDVLGDNVPLLRLQNVFAMVALLGFFLWAGETWKKAERFLLLCAVMTFSSYFATGYFAEYRSYYMQFVCGICFYSCAYALLRGDLLAALRERRVAVVVFTVSGVLLINLHFVTALLAETSLAGLAATAWFLGQRRLAILMCAVGLLAAMPLLTDLIFQAPYLLRKAGGHFWIDTGFLGALAILVGSIAKGIGLNGVACFAAGGVLLRIPIARTDRRNVGMAPDTVIGVAFLGFAVVPLGALLILNVYTPIIVDRYLLLCSAAIICGLSVLAQEAVFSRRAGFALVVANAVLFLGVAGIKLIGEPRWNASAALIGAEVAACPTSRVEAFPFPRAGVMASEDAVYALGYRYLAERHGFLMTMARPNAPLARDTTGRCPTILWTENVLWTQPAPDALDAQVLDAAREALGPIDLGGAVVERTKTGALIVLQPRGSS